MKEKPLLLKASAFSTRIINLYTYLNNIKKEFTISKQILRSGTSIGANISEAYDACSKKDFLAKMQISLKECSETLYWLEIKKMLVSTVKTTKTNLATNICSAT